MSSIISVENLCKAYRLGHKEEAPDSLVAAACGIIKAPLRNWRRLQRLDTSRQTGDEEDLLWALRNVSFEVQRGEVVGIIGRNGAGKSTLLKILSRITEPTSGRIVLRGRVSSLLEVGTGFHPELSGRDNIYMNGTILGMKKREIDRKFDEIVDFSGVEKFLDTPVKRYSSGMTVRLAFAVAAHLQPEILIVDEVLAVGDSEFQKKCLDKMRDVADGGRTVLLVSHNMSIMESLCRTAIQLKAGELLRCGNAAEIVRQYASDAKTVSMDQMHRGPAFTPIITRVEILGAAGESVPFVRSGDDVTFRIHLDHSQPLPKARIGLRIDSIAGARMLHVQSEIALGELIELPSRGYVDCSIPRFPLVPGFYSTAIALFSERRHLDHVEPAVDFTVEVGDFYQNGCLPTTQIAQFLSPSEWTVAH